MHVAAVWRSPVNSIYEPSSAGATTSPAALAPSRRRRSQAARIRPGSLSASADFTADVAAEVAARLAKDEAEPGVYTPAAAFGPDLARAAGATFILD